MILNKKEIKWLKENEYNVSIINDNEVHISKSNINITNPVFWNIELYLTEAENFEYEGRKLFVYKSNDIEWLKANLRYKLIIDTFKVVPW